MEDGVWEDVKRPLPVRSTSSFLKPQQLDDFERLQLFPVFRPELDLALLSIS